MMKVPALVRMPSTTPVLLGPTTVERFIYNAIHGRMVLKTTDRPDHDRHLRQEFAKDFRQQIGLREVALAEVCGECFSPTWMEASSRTCRASALERKLW